MWKESEKDNGGEMKTSTLIYGVSLGVAFYLTGINILTEFIPPEKKLLVIIIGIVFVVFGSLLLIITLIWYISHREDKMRNNKIGIGKEKYVLIGIFIGLLGGFLLSVLAGIIKNINPNILIGITQIIIGIIAIIIAFWIAYHIYKKERENFYRDKVFELIGKLMTNYRFKGHLPIFQSRQINENINLSRQKEEIHNLLSHCAMSVPLTWNNLGIQGNYNGVPDDIRGGVLLWCLSEVDLQIGVDVNWTDRDAISQPNLFEMSDKELYQWIQDYKANTVLEFIWVVHQDSMLHYIQAFADSPIYQNLCQAMNLYISPQKLIERVKKFFELYFKNLEIVINIENYLKKYYEVKA